MAASGGYYVAAPCRYIFANELTITGSIGVIMQSINLHGLLDKVGVKPVTFKSGPNKDMLSSLNPPEATTTEQKEIMQRFIDDTYDAFVKVVEEGRAKKGNRTEKDARIFFCTVSFLSSAFFHHFDKGIVGVVYESLHDFLLLRGRCLRRVQAGEHVLVGAALEGDRFDADFIQ